MTFERPSQPLVSAIVVTYGQRDIVQRMLRSLHAHTTVPFELIVVDNGSTDGTTEWVRDHVEGAVIVLNERNLGFGSAANQGALRAGAPYLCFLNSDLVLEPGWAEPLVVEMADEGTAAVAPCLRNLDGSVQQAGALVGGDGSTQYIGADPEGSVARFRRPVDYASAACLLVRRSAFLSLGGFDAAFGEGYYEDVDLCFRLQVGGRRVMYAPASTVKHVAGASSSETDRQRLLVMNSELLRERWHDALALRPHLHNLATAPRSSVSARDALLPERVLLVGDDAPMVRRATSRCGSDTQLTVACRRSKALVACRGELEDAGIEVGLVRRWAPWLRARRYHYSEVVVAPSQMNRELKRLLRETQPQADLSAPDG